MKPIDSAHPRHVVVMGVSGTGKTTIGLRIADHLDSEFLEGDEFHSQANIAKMASGMPLTDEDRWPWLERLAAEIARCDAQGTSTVSACSALRRSYRDRLRKGSFERLFFVHLHTDFGILRDRMVQRDHYMPASLLQSQFDTLEALADDEAGVVIDDSVSIEEVVTAALAALDASA